MQKNDKSYAFLLSHSSKSRIYIRRIAVSKRLVHFGSLGVFLLIGITTDNKVFSVAAIAFILVFLFASGKWMRKRK